MKMTLLLLTLLLISSCEKEGQSSVSSSKMTSESSLSVEKVKVAEIKTINDKLNSDPQYQLTKEEYQTLVASGLLSESEKEELGSLFK